MWVSTAALIDFIALSKLHVLRLLFRGFGDDKIVHGR